MEAKVEEALAKLRPGFQADGADLKLKSVNGDTAEIELVLGPDACLECILPADVLTTMLQRVIQEEVPEIQTVKLIDPR